MQDVKRTNAELRGVPACHSPGPLVSCERHRLQGEKPSFNVLLNPAVEHDQKLSLLDAIVKRIGGNKLLRNFIAVLIDNKRIHQMSDIAVQFRQELDQRMGIADARVSSFRPLTAAEKKSLEKQLTAVTGKKVRATYAEDSSLLGGALVRVGSTIYDGSVRGQLQRIKQEIAGA